MIQGYQNLHDSVTEFCFNDIGQIQKIFSTARYITLSIRFPGKTTWLYLGRGGGFEGIWFSDKPPVSKLRIKDKFLDYLRKYLSGVVFLGLEIDTDDRIVIFKYQVWGKACSFYYFYKGRATYFLNHYYLEGERKLYSSWLGLVESRLNPLDLFDELGRTQIKKEVKKENYSIEKLLEFEESQRTIGTKNKVKKLKRKIINIEQDLKKITTFINRESEFLKWKERIALGESLDILDQKKINLDGVKVKFTKEMSTFQKIELLFDKRKRLKKVQLHLIKRLEEAQALLIKVKDSDVLKRTYVSPVWSVDKAKKKEIKKEKFQIFEISHMKIAIGRSAQENDEIRSRWAKKNDWWFHIENRPSAHAYIKRSDQASFFEQEEMRVIAELIVKQTNLSLTEVPLIYTQVKNLKGVKGKPGSVFFKKEKRIQVYLN